MVKKMSVKQFAQYLRPRARARELLAKEGERGMIASDLYSVLRQLVNGL